LTRHIRFCRNFIGAFTLAEVLVTLGIIGVIAAITLPTIITNIQEKHFRTAALKAYSTASNIILKMNIDDEYQRNSYYSNMEKENLAKHFSKYFDGSKIIAISTRHKYYKSLDGSKDVQFAYLGYEIQAKDGITYSTYTNYHSGYEAHLTPGITDMSNGIVLYIIVDVNGDKNPNTLGKDVFV